MDTKAVIYLTDNSLDKDIETLCQRNLKEQSYGFPIVCVSQKKSNFGDIQVCVGNIGRCWLSLYRQLYAGVRAVDTDYVCIAEHDCLYTYEYLSWIPRKDDTFFYNANHWLVQWKSTRPEFDGMYSYWPRRLALSQLTCNRELLMKLVKQRLDFLADDITLEGEFGAMKARRYALKRQPKYLQKYMRKYVSDQKNERFETKYPNVDIRHKTNFTGPRRGKKRTYTIPYWGTWSEVVRRELACANC